MKFSLFDLKHFFSFFSFPFLSILCLHQVFPSSIILARTFKVVFENRITSRQKKYKKNTKDQ